MKMLRIDYANHAWIGAYAALAGILLGLLMALAPEVAGYVPAQVINASLGCFVAAFLRELYGLWKGRSFDPLDLGATLIGGVPVVFAAAL